MTNTNKTIVFTLLASVVWAILFIASAKLLKGNPAKEWVQAALYGFGFFQCSSRHHALEIAVLPNQLGQMAIRQLVTVH